MGELVAELAPLVAGLRVRDVQSLPPTDLVLVLEDPDGGDDARPVRVRLSADRGLPRLHLQHGRLPRRGGPVGPFFQAVSTALEDARLVELAQVGGDRAVRATFRTPAGGAGLVLELFGRNANLCLLDGEGRIAELLSPPAGRPGSGDPPRLEPGSPWRPPAGGAPPGDAGEPLARALPDPGEPPPHAPSGAPLSWAVEAVLGGEAEQRRVEALRKRLLDRVARREARTRRNLRGLEEREREAESLERLRESGELLKAHQHELKRGLDRVELPDWFAGEGATRVVELDPGLSPAKNVSRLFSRYRKLKRKVDNLPAERGFLEERLAQLDELLARAEDPAGTAADLEALAEEAARSGVLEPEQAVPKRRPPPGPRRPYRSFEGCRGSEIRVGRTAADNDELTLRHSRGNDLWLHTADAPGSHVVLRVQGREEPDAEEVLDAAHLAAHFSPLRSAARVNVHVARRKEVHKPRGAKAGLVHLSGGKVLRVRMQPERLARLLGKPGAPGVRGERP